MRRVYSNWVVRRYLSKNLFGFWFAGESEQQWSENWTSIEVRSTTGMTYGPGATGRHEGVARLTP